MHAIPAGMDAGGGAGRKVSAMGAVRESGMWQRHGARLLAGFFTFFCLMLTGLPAQAELSAQLVAQAMTDFGRMVLKFDKMPEYKIAVSTGVLVIEFGEPTDIDVSKTPLVLKDYIGAARVDPDKMAIRFALTSKMTINTMEAGEQLFVDFLPSDWQGLPPGLPADVVADLARRAKVAEEKARIEALRKAGFEPNPDVRVSVGEYPTFSRIVFHWDRKVEPALKRDGNKVAIEFKTRGRPDLTRLRAAKPRLLKNAGKRESDGHLVIDLEIDRLASVRAFSEGKDYVVDLSDAANPAASGLDGILLTAQDGGIPGAPAQDEPVTRFAAETGQPPAGGEAADVRAAGAPALNVSYLPFDPVQFDPQVFADTAAVEFKPGQPAGMGQNPDAAGQGADGKPAPAKPASDVQAVKAGTGGVTAAATPGAATASTGDVVRVRAHRIGSSVKLEFPFPEKVAASVFTRADTVWIVFDTAIPIDTGTIGRDYADRLKAVDVTRSGSMQFLRLKLVGRDLTTALAKLNDWIVTMGDSVLEPAAPLALSRRFASDGSSQVAVDIKDAGQVHWIRDPELGDLLAVVTAFGPPRGLVKPQEFVDFQAFTSSHGLALRPRADDLRVTLRVDELVISKGGGLWLSAGGVHQYAAGRADAGSGHRPGFIDFNALNEGGPGVFLARRQAFEEQAAGAKGDEISPARLTLARFYLAHGLSMEALGVLKRMSEEDKGIESDPSFNSARAIANILSHRFPEARDDLGVHGLSQSRDAMLWRGLMEAAAGHWRAAQLAIGEGESVMADYPETLQAKFRLAAIRAALEVKDLADANYQLDALPKTIESDEMRAEAWLLRGRYMETLGRTEDALKYYRDVAGLNVRPAVAEAKLRQATLLARIGKIEPDKLIEELETVAVSWRGDRTELSALRMLSRLYAERREYRRAFETLKSAGIVDPDSEITRQIQDEMAIVFEDLFIHGQADKLPTIDALGLFYDYRNLTPVGRLGDEMIRKLADRLIEVNLLDQAAELLEYQVDNRLKGAARAQIAANLAMVHLKNHQPGKALKTLQNSRVASLPGDLQRQRDLLQARGLAETNRFEQALSLLDAMQGDDVDRLRANTLWQARKWQEAANQIERNLGSVWQDKEPLSDNARYNVMRAAIALSLADDQLGLDRLRTKFAGKMANSPDAKGFEVVTAPVTSKGVAFETLAKNIASIDTLNQFLEDVAKRFGTRPDPGAGANGAAEGEG